MRLNNYDPAELHSRMRFWDPTKKIRKGVKDVTNTVVNNTYGRSYGAVKKELDKATKNNKKK